MIVSITDSGEVDFKVTVPYPLACRKFPSAIFIRMPAQSEKEVNLDLLLQRENVEPLSRT